MPATRTNPYTFRSFDRVTRQTITLDGGPDDVTGTVYLTYVGQGHNVIIGTEGAHVNDDNPGIEYRGAGYIGRVWVIRNADGEWIPDPDNAWNRTKRPEVYYTRRDNWSDAGLRESRAITKRLMRAVAEHYQPAEDDRGELVGAEQAAHMAWDRWNRAQTEADELRAELRKAERYLAKLRKETGVTFPDPEPARNPFRTRGPQTWRGLSELSPSDVERLDALADEYGAERVERWVADGWDYAGSDNPTPPSE